MIKDRNLKLKLLKYFLCRLWYPQLEVDILAKQRVSKSRKLVTDIDVLAACPDITGEFNLILGDCKTLKSQSPISRMLWMKGLMEYLNAKKAFVILEKEIDKDHQLTSSVLNIQLLSEKGFDIYSKHTSNPSFVLNSAIADMNHWDIFFSISSKYPALEELNEYAKSSFWNESESTNRLRHSLLVLKKVRKELNPENPLHLALVLNHISMCAIALNDILIKVFNRYLLPNSKQELNDDLKVLIWGGTENYNYLNELRKKFTSQTGQESDLSLPKWDSFLEFIRDCLQNPLAFNHVPLFIKEHGFMYLDPSIGVYTYAKTLANTNPFIVSYAIKLIEYVTEACEMQKDFSTTYANRFLNIS